MPYVSQPKKLLIINILDILRKHTDEEHRLSQKDILDILRKEYQMNVDRKAVKRNIMNLIDFGYNIEYTEAVRRTPNPRPRNPTRKHHHSDGRLRAVPKGEIGKGHTGAVAS